MSMVWRGTYMQFIIYSVAGYILTFQYSYAILSQELEVCYMYIFSTPSSSEVWSIIIDVVSAICIFNATQEITLYY